eukprot:snap_masked-scaffold_1-processed-gene-13.9-mRNA-1 protein AED:1.00 eAED:1.00 QI:0/0/0/0/1/1/2/0/64
MIRGQENNVKSVVKGTKFDGALLRQTLLLNSKICLKDNKKTEKKYLGYNLNKEINNVSMGNSIC